MIGAGEFIERSPSPRPIEFVEALQVIQRYPESEADRPYWKLPLPDQSKDARTRNVQPIRRFIHVESGTKSVFLAHLDAVVSGGHVRESACSIVHDWLSTQTFPNN